MNRLTYQIDAKYQSYRKNLAKSQADGASYCGGAYKKETIVKRTFSWDKNEKVGFFWSLYTWVIHLSLFLFFIV